MLRARRSVSSRSRWADLCKATPEASQRLDACMAEVRSLASALREIDAVNLKLGGRALGRVRGYLAAVAPRTVAYDRRGASRPMDDLSNRLSGGLTHDLVSLLSNTANGLSAIQAKAATTSNNIGQREHARLRPPAGKPGRSYPPARWAATVATSAAGSTCLMSRRPRDQFVESQLPSAFSNSSSSTAESDALAGVTTFNNGTDGDLTDAMSAFYSSLTALAQNPGDTSLRQSAVQSATWLASTFNRTSVALEQAPQWNRCQRHDHRSKR